MYHGSRIMSRIWRRAVPTVTVAIAAVGTGHAVFGSCAGSDNNKADLQMMLDCAVKSCDGGKTKKFKQMFARYQARANTKAAATAAATPVAVAAAAAAATGQKKSKPKYTCPSRDDLGFCTWTMNPDSGTQAKALGLIEGLAEFYPCVHCRADFQEAVKKYPPRLASKKDFVLWVCEQHNLVNKKLNKATFPCDFEELEERWYKPCLKEDDEEDDEDDEEDNN